jgi:uncharacterized membrane protein
MTLGNLDQKNLTWLASLLLGIIGLADSVYLTWVKWANAYESCVGIGRCDIVNQSRFSELWGQPVALFGALTYLALLALLVAERVRPGWQEWLQLAFFGVCTVGVLFSAYLTYIEVAVLHAICPYCVLSAVVITIMWVLGIARLLREPQHQTG